MALMNAIPAAAVLASSVPEANTQNGPIMLNSAAKAIVKAVTVVGTVVAKAAAARAKQLTNAGSATCQSRSPVRSECAPTMTMAMAAAKYGMAASSPITNGLIPESTLIALGSQNPML